jgi:tyrosyl-tRNA synthetase
MSVSDDLMWRYVELLSGLSKEEVAERKDACRRGSLHPRDAKLAFAAELVDRFHGHQAATEAREAWEAQFSRREVPRDLQRVTLVAESGALWLPKALAEAGLVPSSSEGRRRVKQGAVEVDGERVRDPQASLPKGGPYVVKAGKRAWAEIIVE